MEKLIVHILPNWINISLIILLVAIVVSFVTFLFAAFINKEKLGIVAHATLLISMSLSLVITLFVAIIGHISIDETSYTITKTDDAIRVNSHSDWIENSIYNIIGHRDGVYYLENSDRNRKVIKLPAEMFEKITYQKQ